MNILVRKDIPYAWYNPASDKYELVMTTDDYDICFEQPTSFEFLDRLQAANWHDRRQFAYESVKLQDSSPMRSRLYSITALWMFFDERLSAELIQKRYDHYASRIWNDICAANYDAAAVGITPSVGHIMIPCIAFVFDDRKFAYFPFYSSLNSRSFTDDGRLYL